MVDDATVGATPAVDGATPSQTTPVSPAAAPAAAEPATGDEAALGDPGKKALDAMKRERDDAVKASKALEKRLLDIEGASKSETEKAIDAAKKAGEAEATSRWQAQIRRSEVRAALIGAGIGTGVLDLAVKADEFADLAVSEAGDVDGLTEAVEAFRKARPSLFGQTNRSGSFDTGSGGGRTTPRTYTRAQLRDKPFFDANRADIMAAMAEGRIQN
jgi:hypothetical protein